MGLVEQHAPAESTLGMLQRGRGLGYLRALELPRKQAREWLLKCITRDPCLDSQVESRAEYYAGLVIDLELDLEPLARHLRENDDKDGSGWNTPLTVCTLGELAKRGNPVAVDILCDYLGWGEWWNWPLEDLAPAGQSSTAARVARTLEQRFNSDYDLEENLKWFDLEAEPWMTLARHSDRITRLAGRKDRKGGQASTPFPQGLADAATFGVREILERTNEQNFRSLRKLIAGAVRPSDLEVLMTSISIDKPYLASVALAGLEKLAPPGILDWLLNLLTAGPAKARWLNGYVTRAIVALPGEVTLPFARENLGDTSVDECFLAENIIEKHAKLEDIPLLRESLQLALADDEEHCYRICHLTEAFSRFPGIGPVPELLAVFSNFRYSYGRKLAARAIHTTAPEIFGELFAEECLWDCESDTQAAGADSVALKAPRVLDRLRWLASDPWVEEKTKAAAFKRLGTG